jgi:hypothetical protein
MGRLRLRSDFFEPLVVGDLDYIFYNGSNIFHNRFTKSAFAGQDVVKNERTYDELHAGPPFLSGGPFDSYKSENPWNDVQGSGFYSRKVGLTTYQYKGGFLPTSFGSGQIPYQHLKDVGLKGPFGPDYGDPSSYGASAINRFKPKTSGFDGATALGELRDLPGMIQNAAKKAKGFNHYYKGLGGSAKDIFMPKNIASEYLEHTFGWVPFLSDIGKVYKTYQDYGKILRRLRRQNNQWIKKGGVILENNEVTAREDNFAQDAPSIEPALPTYLYEFPYAGRPNKWGNTYYETQLQSRVWFEGSFKYYIPQLSDFGASTWSQVRNFMQIYGLRVSPSVVWNLTPWTWLADWFANVGDIVDNVTAITYDRLVTRYAYVMGHSRLKRLNASTIHLYGGSVDCLWQQKIDVKRRVNASPFGFSLKTEDFSDSQWAILVSLGLSRGK